MKILIALLLSFPMTSLTYGSNLYTHDLPLSLVTFSGGPWTASELKTNLEEAAKVYAQCGVNLKVDHLTQASGDGEILFDLEGYTDPNDIREDGSALDYGKKYSAASYVTVFFMSSFDSFYNNIRATAVPQERVKYEDQKDALNTVWLSHQIETMRSWTRVEGGLPYGYSDLAHELGHILLNASHVEGNHIHNLMHENFSNLNGHLTHKQCEKIKKSPLLTKRTLPQDLVCPEITSPLRGAIKFVHHAEQDCATIAEIINTLDSARDSVSDLAPLSGIDFYFEERSDLIQYSDRNYFEASLNITFDGFGLYPIRKEQADMLWIHELGHALLNAKLEEDWPWYKGRLDIMKKWGQLVRNDANAEEISKQISLLMSYPNNIEFDDILAPYHELFADAVTVIYTRNPEAIKMGLDHPTQPDPQADLERDFSHHHPFENWHEEEAHNLLSPVRSHIWKLITQLKPYERTNQEILRTLYIAIRDEVIERTENQELWDLSVPDINLRLIKKIPRF